MATTRCVFIAGKIRKSQYVGIKNINRLRKKFPKENNENNYFKCNECFRFINYSYKIKYKQNCMNMIGVFILFTKYIFLFLEGKILTVLVILWCTNAVSNCG